MTKLEREAVRIVIDERLAGNPDEFFRDACGIEEPKAEELAEALRTAAEKI